MPFLGVTETCDLLSLYLRLQVEGHEVRVAISDPLVQGTGAGLIDRVENWRVELDWIRKAGTDGVIRPDLHAGRLDSRVQDEVREKRALKRRIRIRSGE